MFVNLWISKDTDLFQSRNLVYQTIEENIHGLESKIHDAIKGHFDFKVSSIVNKSIKIIKNF